jgi:hypothetical protein
MAMAILTFHALGSDSGSAGSEGVDAMAASAVDARPQTETKKMKILKIAVGDAELTAPLADNSPAAAPAEPLSEKPLTLDMRDYGGFEKVGSSGRSLPTNDERIDATAGDLILYRGSDFVIYYSTNSWTFTRLGRIDNAKKNELRQILGNGDVTVTLSVE